jgi:hypothetical protein
MRQSLFLVAVLAALGAVTVPAAAQSPTSYPWCMKGARGGTSCYSAATRNAGPRCPALAAGACAARTTAARIAEAEFSCRFLACGVDPAYAFR